MALDLFGVKPPWAGDSQKREEPRRNGPPQSGVACYSHDSLELNSRLARRNRHGVNDGPAQQKTALCPFSLPPDEKRLESYDARLFWGEWQGLMKARLARNFLWHRHAGLFAVLRPECGALWKLGTILPSEPPYLLWSHSPNSKLYSFEKQFFPLIHVFKVRFRISYLDYCVSVWRFYLN